MGKTRKQKLADLQSAYRTAIKRKKARDRIYRNMVDLIVRQLNAEMRDDRRAANEQR